MNWAQRLITTKDFRLVLGSISSTKSNALRPCCATRQILGSLLPSAIDAFHFKGFLSE
jgi:DNA topoisomerase IB